MKNLDSDDIQYAIRGGACSRCDCLLDGVHVLLAATLIGLLGRLTGKLALVE